MSETGFVRGVGYGIVDLVTQGFTIVIWSSNLSRGIFDGQVGKKKRPQKIWQKNKPVYPHGEEGFAWLMAP